MTHSNIAGAINAAHAGVEIRSVWAKHYAYLTDADRKEAGRRVVEMIVEMIPRAKLLELISRLKNVPASDIAIAMGDVQEERKRKATEVPR